MYRTMNDVLTPVLVSILAAIIFASTAASVDAAPKQNLDGKVVLANLDRYEAILRFGKIQKKVQPKKATVVTPKKYPVTIEYWSGNKASGWTKATVDAAGVYGLNFKQQGWVLTLLKKGSGTPTLNHKTPAVKPGYRRVARRPAKSSRVNVDRRFWHPLTRVTWAAASLYQFIRDEDDRDFIRHMILEGREQDLKDFEKWVDDSDLAEHYKDQIRDAYEDLSEISDSEWKEIEGASDADWLRAKEDLGELVDDNSWKDLTDDLGDIDTKDFWEDSEDLDLDEIDVAEDLDVGDLDLDESVDLGDLGIDTDNYDLGAYDDFGDYGNDDFGDDDVGDFGGGDFGGGFDDFGGGDFGDDF